VESVDALHLRRCCREGTPTAADTASVALSLLAAVLAAAAWPDIDLHRGSGMFSRPLRSRYSRALGTNVDFEVNKRQLKLG